VVLMRSITFWNRLEPRPRSTNIAPALSARVRDPLWMLTRQWQFGEFQGEDAAAPAYAQISASDGRLLGWQRNAQSFQAVQGGVPLEPMVLREDFSPDLASRVEVGQLFEKLLTDAGVPELVPEFRTVYPVTPMTDAELAASPDRESARFRQVVAGRVVDGIALFQAAQASAPALPSQPAIESSKRDAVHDALTKLDLWIREVWGGFSTNDPVVWKPERLEYQVSLVAAAPTQEPVVIAGYPGSTGDFNWQALEIAPGPVTGVSVPSGAVRSSTRSLIPGRVQFRGMPNHRWWDFEHGQIDFGGIQPDTRDLIKLIFMDFMLVHGNDWFLIPLEQTAGSLCRIDSLVVHDVFGGATEIVRADANAGAVDQRWTMFSTPAQSAPHTLSDFFVLPSNVGPASQRGLVMEEVVFLRDEMANMAWAVEITTESEVGKPMYGYDRDLSIHAKEPRPAGPPDAAAPALRYRIQTRVPENWIPLLPVVIDPSEGDVALERGAMLTDTPNPTPILPVGRILAPSSLQGEPYRIREEEVPREGLKVARVICRTRGTDGSTHLWIARRKQIGRGEGSSGLRFDLAVEKSV
jgi:hypothetical protein